MNFVRVLESECGCSGDDLPFFNDRLVLEEVRGLPIEQKERYNLIEALNVEHMFLGPCREMTKPQWRKRETDMFEGSICLSPSHSRWTMVNCGGARPLRIRNSTTSNTRSRLPIPGFIKGRMRTVPG